MEMFKHFKMKDMFSVAANAVRAPSGRDYSFSNIPTKVYDETDIKFFENDERFEEAGPIPTDAGKQVEEVKKETKKVEKKPKPKPEKLLPRHTKKELYAMTKREQVKLLKSLGVKKIPRLEKDRVKKILELTK